MRLWILVGCLLPLLVACGRVQNERFVGTPAPTDPSLALTASVAEGLMMGEAGTLELELSRAGVPVTEAQIEVQGTMSHAGMEPLWVVAEAEGEGRYLASLPWTMGGEWLLTVHVTLPDGTTLERRLEPVQVASP